MENLLNMIPEASSIRAETEKNESYRKQIKASIEQLNKRIKEAMEQGRNSTGFTVSYMSVKDEVRSMYATKGYKFRPTGMVGGVMQKTEDIYW